jgi:3-oxoacyl-[acyl-carrier protein] reductase
MDLGLQDKRALVLASTRGLGHGVASALASEGAQVTICGRKGSHEAALEMTDATGAAVHGIDTDLHDRAAVDRLVDEAFARMGGVDILVLNGGGPPPSPALDIGDAMWREWFEHMVATLIHVAGRCVPDMRERGWGRVLTIASSAAVQPIVNMALSNSLRATLLAWSKTLAAEVAQDGVTCNVILPGRIHTERVDRLDQAAADRQGIDLEAARGQSLAGIPMKRYGSTREFGAAGAFLCSGPASYVTGTVLRVDGGIIRAI